MKQIAVCRRNNLVNIVELQRMGQQQNETVTAFTSRLNRQADVCDLHRECPSCHHDVLFKDKILMYQRVRGLADVTEQERILEAAAQVEGDDLSLTRVIKLAEAFEKGKSSQELVNSAGQVSKISDHELKKRGSRQESRQATQGQRNSKSKDTRSGCGHCGRSDHSSRLADRYDKCPAFDKSCTKCHLNGHFSQQCRTKNNKQGRTSSLAVKPNSKVNSVNAEKEKTTTQNNDEGDLGTLSGSWMLICGREPEPSNMCVRPQKTGGQVKCQDIGQDWNHEVPGLQPGSGEWPQQQQESSNHKHVHKVDTKGRQLAPCGCLLRTPTPPPPPQQPSFTITP